MDVTRPHLVAIHPFSRTTILFGCSHSPAAPLPTPLREAQVYPGAIDHRTRIDKPQKWYQRATMTWEHFDAHKTDPLVVEITGWNEIHFLYEHWLKRIQLKGPNDISFASATLQIIDTAVESDRIDTALFLRFLKQEGIHRLQRYKAIQRIGGL